MTAIINKDKMKFVLANGDELSLWHQPSIEELLISAISEDDESGDFDL